MSSGEWVERCMATTLGGGNDGLNDPPHARVLQRSLQGERHTPAYPPEFGEGSSA